jgi:hypothetical protein
MLTKSGKTTQLERTTSILSMLDPRTDGPTRLIALDHIDKMLKTAGLQWIDLAPLIAPKDDFVKRYPGGVGIPSEIQFRKGLNFKRL